MDDGAQVQLLGGDHGEAFAEVKTHLVTEYADGAGAGAVFLAGAMVAHVAHEIEILLHAAWVSSCLSL